MAKRIACDSLIIRRELNTIFYVQSLTDVVTNVELWQYVAFHPSLARIPVGGGVSPQRHLVVLGWWCWAHHTCADRNVNSSELMWIFMNSPYLRGSYRYQLKTDNKFRQSRFD